MKYITLATIAVATAGMFLTGCSDNDWAKGNPQMEVREDLGTAHFGDSLRISVKVSDSEVPLSTLKARLYFGEELVSESTIRTRVSGAEYKATVYIPYLANIPDGRAYLELVLQNINFTTTTKAYEVMVTHPDYEYLTFVTEDGANEYRMERQAQYVYSFTEKLPQECKGYIIAPAFGENGNELRFGYESSMIKVGAEGAIPFSANAAGKYTVEFNTFTFEGSPFNLITCNGNPMTGTSNTTSEIDMNLNPGDVLTFSGITEYGSYWIDPDFFTQNADGSLVFAAPSGSYRIIANSRYKYFRVYGLTGGKASTYQNGGAVWIIGEGIGKPSYAEHQVGWTTEEALFMVPDGAGKYSITLVGGQNVATNAINFKFFGEMGWGGEYKSANIVSNSPLIGIGNVSNGHDDGNLFLNEGVALETNAIYVFTVDTSVSPAVLTVSKEGEIEIDEDIVTINGEKMTTADNVRYSLDIDMTQGGTVNIQGLNASEMYADVDYFEPTSNGWKFRAIDGKYRLVVNSQTKTLGVASKLNGNADLTLADDGTGALWMMGTGFGQFVCSNEIGWTEHAAYCVAQIAPGVYQFTGRAAESDSAVLGDRWNAKAVQFKFFHQNAWGAEYADDEDKGYSNLTLTEAGAEYLTQAKDGNYKLVSALEVGTTYRVTIDLTAGKWNGTITFEKL